MGQIENKAGEMDFLTRLKFNEIAKQFNVSTVQSLYNAMPGVHRNGP